MSDGNKYEGSKRKRKECKRIGIARGGSLLFYRSEQGRPC